MANSSVTAASNDPIELEEILRLLPHRPPALCVDSALPRCDLTPPSIKAFYRVKEIDCDGHFPGLPVMPWYIWVESAFQAGGLLVARIDGHPVEGMARRIQEAKFSRPAEPGNLIELQVTLVERRHPTAIFEATGFIEGVRAFTGLIGIVAGIHPAAPRTV